MPLNEAPSGAPTATLEDTERGGPVAFALATGAQVGRYVIVDRLGAGGMGTVYVAYDAQLARRVAIKVLRPDKKGEEAQARLLREAQTMAQLAHPNVVAVHDVGTFGDGVFIAMEYVEGETLRTWLNGPRSWRETLGVLQAAGRGLEAAHAAGIVHRDFKPDNVLIGNDGRVVVGDFGIARADRGGHDDAPSRAPAMPATPSSGPTLPPEVPSGSTLDSKLTQTDAIVGTVGYMSPERAFEQRDDARSDQFSFSVTLYRALYGQSPFEFSSLPTYLEALLAPPRPPPAGSRVPSWVRDVVLRGLAYEASERFASMTELLDALGRDPSRRRQGWIMAACGLTLVGLAGLGWAQHAASLRAESRVGERLIAETWSPEVRSKVRGGIGATGLPLAGEFAERTQVALDAYAAEWARTHREASEATLIHGRESAATMKQRLSCLEGARDELSALASLLSRADAVIANHAISAAYGLPVPRACLEPGAGRGVSLAADTPERRARMTALRRAVAEAEADRMTGKNEEALATANRALAEARAIPHRQSEAELLFLVGACQRELEDDAVARVTFEEAFAAAEAADNDSLAVIAAAVVSLELGDTLADKHEAARWLAIAKGVREREHGVADDRADAEVLEAELSLESAGGHPERTLALRDQLVATLERVYGASHPRIGSAIANRAGDFASTGQPERAFADYRRAIAMQEQIFGRDYPSLSIYYNNFGSTLSAVGRYVEAKEALDRSLALVAPLGPSSSHNVLPLVTMATLQNRVGDRDAALASAERGLAIADASGDVRFAPGLRVQRGIALLAKGNAEASLESCQAALADEEKQEILGPDKTYPDGEDALACLGNAELALGRASDAVAHLERSVSLTKRETPAELSLARFDLARALGAAKQDPVRARLLAETARSELHAAPGMEQAASDADAWLAKASAP